MAFSPSASAPQSEKLVLFLEAESSPVASGRGGKAGKRFVRVVQLEEVPFIPGEGAAAAAG